MKPINLLINLANRLDDNGLYVTAREVDNIIDKFAFTNIEFFFDMDGVLANFDAAVKAGADVLAKGFFLNLQPLPGAEAMLDEAMKLTGRKPNILSAPFDITEELRAQCETEKTEWLKKHFSSKINKILYSTTKYEFASPNACLIDDKPSMVQDFAENGGFGILHTDPGLTIVQMRNLVNSHSQVA